MAPGKITDSPRSSGFDFCSQSSSPTKDSRLPVTVLSGFLGAGKTTILKHILTSPDHGLRIGVIVNDVGALNIDAALLENHNVTRKEEQLVAMQNGCICCTLRGDLLEEVARLADEKQVDYLVIESSGVSEPMNVAETFADEFAEMHVAAGYDLEADSEGEKESNKKIIKLLKAGGLSKMSRLDTCVTVIDAVNFQSDFATVDRLNDRQDDVPEEDDRNISDLQVDQVEFANVIIINKCDLVSKEVVQEIKATVKQLNMGAKILTTVRGKIDVKEIIDTKIFAFEEATNNAGWLRSLNEEMKPETEEYGIGNFVYRARRPFEPKRLWDTIKGVFVIAQFTHEEEGDEWEDDDGEENDGEDEEQYEEEKNDDDEEEEEEQLNPKERLAAKMADETFGPLLRSKGFLWLATRPSMYGEWSQAGIMLTISGGDLWRCEIPEDQWTENREIRERYKKDYEGKWGDRRQEIVFIGQKMRAGGEARIRKVLDQCLLNDEEFQAWEEAMESEDTQERLDQLFEDGYEDWPLLVPGDDEMVEHIQNHAGHSHAGHNHNHKRAQRPVV